jgi:hypothetical protein
MGQSVAIVHAENSVAAAIVVVGSDIYCYQHENIDAAADADDLDDE